MAAMATVSMFSSPRDSTLSVNSRWGGEPSSPQERPGRVFVQTGVTVATECPSAERRGSQRPWEPRFPLHGTELNTQ